MLKLALLLLTVIPTPSDSELVWSKWLAENLGGTQGYHAPDGSFVDILTDTHAVEIDFVSKWEEARNQAKAYARITNRRPAVILLAGRKESHIESADIWRCLFACDEDEIDTWILHMGRVEDDKVGLPGEPKLRFTDGKTRAGPLYRRAGRHEGDSINRRKRAAEDQRVPVLPSGRTACGSVDRREHEERISSNVSRASLRNCPRPYCYSPRISFGLRFDAVVHAVAVSEAGKAIAGRSVSRLSDSQSLARNDKGSSRRDLLSDPTAGWVLVRGRESDVSRREGGWLEELERPSAGSVVGGGQQ